MAGAMGGQHSLDVEPRGYEIKGVEMEIKAGCLCGAVRYTAEVDPTNATVCHRRDCQKFTNSAFAAGRDRIRVSWSQKVGAHGN